MRDFRKNVIGSEKLSLLVSPAERAEVIARATEIADALITKPPIAVRYILQAVSDGIDKNLDAALNMESELFGNICGTEDMKEGTTAFLEKRQANFKGK